MSSLLFSIRVINTSYYEEKQWIDAGGNPAVRHEGGAPSNNLIKDAPHRATVFVGPTLKSLFPNNRCRLAISIWY